MRKNNKVAFFSLSYRPSMGGLVTYIDSFSKHLIDRNVCVDVFCGDAKDDDLARKEKIKGATVFRYSVFKAHRILKFISPLLVVAKFYRFFKKISFEKYDVIICRHFYLAFVLSFFRGASEKTVFILPLITPKLQLINAKQQPFFQKIYSFIIVPQLYFLEKIAVSRLPHVAVLSHSKEKEVKGYYNLNKDIAIIPPGVDNERFSLVKQEEKNNLRQQFFSSELRGVILICTVCRLVEEKNVITLLRSFKILIEGSSSDLFRLLIAGDGPLMNSLIMESKRLGIDQYVNFLGHTDKPEEVYQAADIFVLPSLYEGFGHVLIEANACGTPVIGFKNAPPEVITASDEIIIDGINGKIVHSASDEALAEKLLELSHEIKELGIKCWEKKCIEYVNDRFSWSQHLEKVMSFTHR